MQRRFTWQWNLKFPSSLVWGIIDILRLMTDHVNPVWISSILVLFRRLHLLRRRNGISYLARYLKACHIYVMQYVACTKKLDSIHSHTYGITVGLTASGIPSILPVYLRSRLRSRNINDIRMILTIFNLYRVLPYPGRVKIETITDPFIGEFPSDVRHFIPRFWAMLSPRPFQFLWNPFAIQASGAVVNGSRTSSVSGFFKALVELRRDPVLWKAIQFFFCVVPSRRGWQARTARSFRALDLLSSCLVRAFPYANSSVGRLAFKEEPGKVRVFAMVDCVTQWVLRPLHDWIFAILKLIPQDATFDQEAGVQKILEKIQSGQLTVFSLDLSAATDRLPVLLQARLLDFIFSGLGTQWSNLLVSRSYKVPSHPTLPHNPGFVKYGAGQPMGAYSSWAMLALTHHFIVQYSAWSSNGGDQSLPTNYEIRNNRVFCTGGGVSPPVWFKDYMILGDDLLILNQKVANRYLQVMESLGVGVNMSKSLISTTGCGEFAKKFITPQGRAEGVSLKEFTSLGMSISNLLAVQRKLGSSRTRILRVLGYGPLSSGHSVLNWTRTSLRSYLDHLLIAPLGVQSSLAWSYWIGFLGPSIRFASDGFHHSLLIFTWGWEVSKFLRVRIKRRPLLMVDWENLSWPSAQDLFNYWLPSKKSGGIPVTNEVWAIRKWWESHIMDVFSSSSLLSEIVSGSSESLVSELLRWELAFEDRESFSRFVVSSYANFWSVLIRDPNDSVSENSQLSRFDVIEFMAQKDPKDPFRPDSLKDISLALQLKKEFWDWFGLGKECMIPSSRLNKAGRWTGIGDAKTGRSVKPLSDLGFFSWNIT